MTSRMDGFSAGAPRGDGWGWLARLGLLLCLLCGPTAAQDAVAVWPPRKPPADPFLRLVRAEEWMATRPGPERLVLLRDLWDGWLWQSPRSAQADWAGVVRTVLRSLLEELPRDHPPARDVLAGWAAELEAQVRAHPSDWLAWQRFVLIAPELVGERAVLGDVEDLLAHHADLDLTTVEYRWLRMFCRRHGNELHVGLLSGDVVEAVRHALERTDADLEDESSDAELLATIVVGRFGEDAIRQVQELMAEERRRQLTDEGRRETIIGSLREAATAGRPSVEQAATLLLAAQDTAAARLDLVEAILDADRLWSGVAARDDAFGRHVAGLSRPRERFEGALQVWLTEAAEFPDADLERVEDLTDWLEHQQAEAR